MGEKQMKKLFWFFVGFWLVFSVGIAQAEHLAWDVSIGADGYIVYFSNGTDNYNYNVGNQTTCEMNVLNLAFGVEYTFHVTAYNDAGESGASNTVAWTNETYVPPENTLPSVVIQISGPVTINIGGQ